MTDTNDKNLEIIVHELKFVGRMAQRSEGNGGSDFDRVDEIGMAGESALRTLEEYKLGLAPVSEETPEAVTLPEAT